MGSTPNQYINFDLGQSAINPEHNLNQNQNRLNFENEIIQNRKNFLKNKKNEWPFPKANLGSGVGTGMGQINNMMQQNNLMMPNQSAMMGMQNSGMMGMQN